MPFIESEGLRRYEFDLFSRSEIVQGIFTREGGVSPAPWASLNLGGTVGDERANVVENRKRIFDSVNRPVESIFDVWQVHGTDVICSETPRPLDGQHQPADAILTNSAEITLFMRFADCVPIFLHDPVHHVIGIVHAGWKGTVAKAARITVEKMQSQYGCSPADVLAGIGPSISPQQYIIGPDVISQTKASFQVDAERLLDNREGRTYLDLWTANRIALEEAGVKPNHIQVAGICTAQNTDLWFSHRGDQGKTGRFGALLALASKDY